MDLVCGVCLYVAGVGNVAAPAVTVLGGTALCDDHLGYGQSYDAAVRSALRFEREERERSS